MRHIYVFICIVFALQCIILRCTGICGPAELHTENRKTMLNYEADVLKCIDYLESIPLDDESAKTRDANAFLLKWITGSPE